MLRNYKSKLVAILVNRRTILCVALLVHLVFFVSLAPWKNEKAKLVGDGDPASYHITAKIMQGASYERIQEQFPEADVALEIANRPIAYPLLLAVFYSVFGEHPVVMIVFQIGLSLLSCLLAIATVQAIHGGSRVAGAIGGWMYALNPLLPDFACQVLTEVPFVMLTFLLLYLLSMLHSIQKTHSKEIVLLAIGLLVGVATMVRASMLYFSIPLGVIAVLLSTRVAQERLRGIFLYGVGVILAILPWAIYNKANYNTWRLTLSGEIHLIHMVVKISSPAISRQSLLSEVAQLMAKDGLNYHRTIFERGPYYRKVVFDYISQHPQRALNQFVEGMKNFWWKAGALAIDGYPFQDPPWAKVWLRIYHIIYLLTLAVGFWSLSRLSVSRVWVYYFAVAALYFTLTAGWAGGPRYRLQVLAFSLPIAVAGARCIICRCKRAISRENDSVSEFG